MHAVIGGYVDVIQFLLIQGANVREYKNITG
jgi:hypothetical protein